MSDFKRVQHPVFGKYSVRVAGPNVTVLDEPAVDGSGQPLPAEPFALPTKAAAELTGDDLKQALTDRGLPIKGTADEKRAAVAAFDAANGADPNPTGGDANETQEV